MVGRGPIFRGWVAAPPPRGHSEDGSRPRRHVDIPRVGRGPAATVDIPRVGRGPAATVDIPRVAGRGPAARWTFRGRVARGRIFRGRLAIQHRLRLPEAFVVCGRDAVGGALVRGLSGVDGVVANAALAALGPRGWLEAGRSGELYDLARGARPPRFTREALANDAIVAARAAFVIFATSTLSAEPKVSRVPSRECML